MSEPISDERLARFREIASGHIQFISNHELVDSAWCGELMREVVAEIDRLREESAETRKRYCYNCSDELPEDVYEFCSERCQEVFINIKTGQVDL